MRLLLWILMLITVSSIGQVMQWSSPQKIKGPAIFSKVLGEDQHGIYLLRYRNRFYSKNIILEKYNHLLISETNRNFDLKDARLVKLLMVDHGILIIKSKFNRKTQANDLLAQFLDFDLNSNGDEILLASLPLMEYGDRGNFRVRISDNHQHISVVYFTKSETNKYILHQKAYSSQLEVKFENHLELPYSFDDFYVKDFGVTAKGEIHLTTNYTQRISRREEQKSMNYFVLAQDSVTDYLVTDSVDIKTSDLIYNRWLDKFFVVGFYGTPSEYGIDGFFKFIKPEPTDSNQILQIHQFSDEFIKKINVNSKRKTSISEGYEFLKVVPRSDGGLLCVVEQKEIATESDVIMINGIPQRTSKNVYNFNEILVLNFDNELFIDWEQVIKKNQTTINDGGYFSSAAVYIGDKFIQLIFNDQLRNTGEIMQYTIYNNGKMSSSKLLKTALDYITVIPVESKQVSSNKLIIPTAKNRKFALLKVIYE